jgi:hypothetical protein
VSCLPSKHVVSPFYLVYFTNTLFWFAYFIMPTVTEHWLRHSRCKW